jgi:hypothetical protein
MHWAHRQLSRHSHEEGDGVTETSGIEARLRQATSLPDTLAASFDAFEAVRLLAREHENRVPELFACFMTAADAAVDGREALTAAPSLPSAEPSQEPVRVSAAGADTAGIIGAIAALGALLDGCLSRAVAMSGRRGDQSACRQAAQAAARICQQMARGDDAARLR